jgi:hypothetical protein
MLVKPWHVIGAIANQHAAAGGRSVIARSQYRRTGIARSRISLTTR